MLIEAGADVKHANTQTGYTPLHHAASKPWQLAKSLIEAGADLNAVTNRGETPLGFACYWSRWEVVRVLVNSGADVNQMCCFCSPLVQRPVTPVEMAQLKKLANMNHPQNIILREKVVEFLVAAGARGSDDAQIQV